MDSATAKNKTFSVASVGQLLVGYGFITPETSKAVIAEAPVMRRRIQKAKEKSGHYTGTRTYTVLPPELIAAMQLPAEHDPAQMITEDLIYELIARSEGMRYKKIDPLKLDPKIVTGYFSRPFSRMNTVVPIDRKGHELFVAMANPYDFELQENLQRVTGMKIMPVLSSKSDILQVITEIYGFKKSISSAEAAIEGGYDLNNLEQLFKIQHLDHIEENDRHIVNAVDYILHYAFEQRASDIHIEPKRTNSQIRMRIDGVLHDVYSIPHKIHPPVVSRIKAMSRLDIAERRRPQDGRMKMSLEDREVELRVSTVSTAFGEKAVLRIFDADRLIKDIEHLGFEEDELLRFERLIKQPTGLVLVTGPTGSGKTTTLYSTLRLLSSSEVNITTIEDPIEMVLDDFNQIAVQRRIGQDFSNALRHVLRQDPDIIMVGEIRDGETAENAIQAALTGHLVLSTLHTRNSVGAIARLVELGVKPYLIASTLNMVVAQRLVRTICPHCKVETHLTEEEMENLGLFKSGEKNKRLKSWYGEGCPKCRNTGLFGRTGLYEVLEINDKMRRLIKEETDSRELLKIAKQDGLLTLSEAGIRKLATGFTSYDEVMRVLAM